MATIRDRYILQVDTRGAVGNVGALQSALGRIGAAKAGIAAVGVAVAALSVELVQGAREVGRLEQQLKLITSGSGDLSRTMSTLRNEAAAARTEIGAFSDLYTKLTLSTESLNVSQQEVIQVTSNLSKALQLSGADAATTSAVIRQFGQAMASGTVRGDEFVSLVEGLGPALSIMARETGLTVGKLREMSSSGELTAETMFNMILRSQELNDAFEQLEPTAEQIESAFTQSFSRLTQAAGAALNEVTGFGEAYKNLLQDITDETNTIAAGLEATRLASQIRDFDFDTSSLEDFIAFSGDIDSAYENILVRIQEIRDDLANPLDFWEDNGELEAQLVRLEEFKEKLKELRFEAAGDQLRESVAAEIIPADLIERLKEYKATLDEANEPAEELKRTHEQLNEDLEYLQSLIGDRQANELYPELQESIDITKERLELLNEEIDELRKKEMGDSFGVFFERIVESAEKAVRETEYYQWALEDLETALENGVITQEVYAEAVEKVNSALGNTSEEAERAARALERARESAGSFISSLEQSTADAKFELEALNMSPLQRQIAQIENDINNDLNRAVAELNRQIENGGDAAKIQQEIDRIRTAAAEAIQTQSELARQSYEHQRTFSYGWRKAFEEYQENATNAADNAGKIFDRVTRGMEDAIVGFARTGKFEFKEFAASVLEELLRIQLRQTFSGILGGLGSSGGSSSSSSGGGLLGGLFSGLFAQGGFIPAGTFGIVGERGPELVSGPANVTPGASLGNVIYNINAVDAPSFKALVARDPAFIHAVATKGANTIPRR